jgi:hypothetical protein
VPLVGPVADKLGIDLIWFGVLLGVNMQTSFMHPPFGFALFYLRSVAPKEVKTSNIYWGAIPFVLIQVIMVGLIIAFPNVVSIAKKTDMKEHIELQLEAPAPDSSYDSSTGDDEGDDGDEEEDNAPHLDFSTGKDNK